MKYSVYSYEQIMKDPNYQKICNMFLSLSKDEETTRKLQSILYYGGYLDYSVSSNIMSKNSPSVERQNRISAAYLIIRNPETFNVLVQNKINLFHGTNANALPSIMKYGICSVDESNNRGDKLTTGEEWSRIGGKRDFVSFTDVLDIAEGYSSINPNQKNKDLSFSVVFGTTVADIENTVKAKVNSDIPEVGIYGKLPKESIKVIMVPSDKVNFVKKILNDDIQVVAIDDIEDRFYYIDDVGMISIDENRYNNLKNGMNTQVVREMPKLKESIFTRLIKKFQGLAVNNQIINEGDDYNHEHPKSR